MNLTGKPDFIQWPATHYVFHEKIGPFQATAQKSWGDLHRLKSQVMAKVAPEGFMALYQIKPQMIYRAGMCVEAKPEKLPEGLRYEKFEGGKYARFVLIGSYSQLPEACGKVFDMVEKMKMPVRPAYYIEHYVNDPATTPEKDLITEILIPTV